MERGEEEDAEIIRPAKALVRRAEHDAAQLRADDVPGRVLLLFADALLARAVSLTGAKELPVRAAQARIFVATSPDAARESLALCSPGIGSPVAALVAEKFIATGAERLVSVGFAGGIAETVRRGDIIVVGDALRAEGTSAHYGQRGVAVAADSTIAADLSGDLGLPRRIVTTDAPYRETRRQVERWATEGAVAVEMEHAGFFAAAHFRRVPAGGLVIVSDTLSGGAWVPAPPSSVDASVDRALRQAIDVASRIDA
ncbi:MAG: phosphorylase family protein [Thermoplasmatota archaeon]